MKSWKLELLKAAAAFIVGAVLIWLELGRWPDLGGVVLCLAGLTWPVVIAWRFAFRAKSERYSPR